MASPKPQPPGPPTAPPATKRPAQRVVKAPPQPPPVTQTAFPISSLPRDVLSMVMGFLPVPYRIHTASRVCKQWRSVTLGSVTYHTLYAPDDANAALRLLPSLRHLTLSVRTKNPISLHLPSSLTSLKLCGFPNTDNISIAACPSLTKLHVRRVSSVDAVTTLLKASANTLTSLVLVTEQPLTALTTLRLPALTRLRLNTPESFVFSSHLLESHAAQLTHLRLTAGNAGHVDGLLLHMLVGELAFPALTSLELHDEFADIEQHLRQFIARAPRLHSLTLGDAYALESEEVQRLAATLLTSLRARRGWPQPNTPPSLLARFPRLSAVRGTLVLAEFSLPHLVTHPAGHAIRRICIEHPTAEVLHPVLEHCTQLRSLALDYASETCLASCQPFPSARLPHLTALVLRHTSSPRTVLGFVSEMSAACPNLRHISVITTSPICDQIIRACPSLLVLRMGVPAQHMAAVRQFADHPTVRVVEPKRLIDDMS